MATAPVDSAGGPERRTGTACASCHRRKLKCDRMPICANCKKADIPCTYTAHPSRSSQLATTRDGRKKTRGPYQKGRTVREKELEHVVELLQEKCNVLEAQVHASENSSPNVSNSSVAQSYRRPVETGDAVHALITFPSPSADDRANVRDIIHLQAAHILELWLIYTSTVDPLTKILHCPTFSDRVLDAARDISRISLQEEACLLAVYIAAVAVLEPDEAYSRFGQSKDNLMLTYTTVLDKLLHTVRGTTDFTFPMLQALVIYMGCLRRQTGPGDNVTILFQLALSTARSLGLDDPATYLQLKPLDAELRRRVWWTICRHESAYAEELHQKQQSIMHDCEVALPTNLDDRDIDAETTLPQMPKPRVGVTSMSFVIVMLDIVRMTGKLSKLLKDSRGTTIIHRSNCLKEQSRRVVEETRNRIDNGTLQYCDVSRPWDWFLMIVAKMLLTKAEVMLLECSPTCDPLAIDAFHDMKVVLCLDIVECHQLLIKGEKMKPWQWNFRNGNQWHSLIYVLEETARRPSAKFVKRAWHLIDEIFADMDLLNKHGMKPADRSKLLAVHGRAIDAREHWLKNGEHGHASLPQVSTNPSGSTIGDTSATLEYPSVPHTEPWQIDQSLFDVQEAQMTGLEDLLFWPSCLYPNNG